MRHGVKLFKDLNCLRVSVAHVLPKCGNRETELDDFSESSREAYCACIYVLERYSHRTTVTLLTSKYRLVPLKSFRIPHLELLAWLLLTKLLVTVLEALKGKVKVTPMFCLSDSMVALWWIKEAHKRWGVWIQNRVVVIWRIHHLTFGFMCHPRQIYYTSPLVQFH